MIRDAVIILLGMFALGGTGVVCMVLACALIDREPNLPIPQFPLPAPSDWGGCDCVPACGLYDQDEDEAQRTAVIVELEAWWALPAAVNR
jgi:hypothetical protein